jgi:hypothetical protein
LGEGIRGRGDPKGVVHGGVQLGGAPAGELRSAMQQDLHQAQHARVVDLDARHRGASGGDRLGEALEQREVDMHIEEVRLDARQAIGHGDQLLAKRRQLLQSLVQAEILEPVDANLDPQERAELLVGARHEALAVDAEDVMAMVEFLQHRVQVAAEPPVLAYAEDLGDDVGCQPEHPQLTGALEDLVDRKMTAEHEIPTVLHLV